MTAKNYHIQQNIGKSKYVVSYHDGIKKHEDQSDFYDLRTFRNKKALKLFVDSLKASGYVER